MMISTALWSPCDYYRCDVCCRTSPELCMSAYMMQTCTTIVVKTTQKLYTGPLCRNLLNQIPRMLITRHSLTPAAQWLLCDKCYLTESCAFRECLQIARMWLSRQSKSYVQTYSVQTCNQGAHALCHVWEILGLVGDPPCHIYPCRFRANAHLERASAVTISSMSRERLLTVMRGTASLPQTTLTHQSRMAGSSDSLTRPPGGQYAQHFRSAPKQAHSSTFL